MLVIFDAAFNLVHNDRWLTTRKTNK